MKEKIIQILNQIDKCNLEHKVYFLSPNVQVLNEQGQIVQECSHTIQIKINVPKNFFQEIKRETIIFDSIAEDIYTAFFRNIESNVLSDISIYHFNVRSFKTFYDLFLLKKEKMKFLIEKTLFSIFLDNLINPESSVTIEGSVTKNTRIFELREVVLTISFKTKYILSNEELLTSLKKIEQKILPIINRIIKENLKINIVNLGKLDNNELPLIAIENNVDKKIIEIYKKDFDSFITINSESYFGKIEELINFVKKELKRVS